MEELYKKLEHLEEMDESYKQIAGLQEMDQPITPSDGMREFPFWRDGMTAREFELERRYYQEHFSDLVQTGKYRSLYEQLKE